MARIARGTARDVGAAVQAAQSALDGAWGKLDAASRGRLLCRLADLIRRDAETLARMESEDGGKPLSQARADAQVCARYFEYYGGAADKVHGDTIPFVNGHTVMTVWEPHGVSAHIVPWNYPLQMTARSVAPSLAMGSAAVLRPADDTSLTALALARGAGRAASRSASTAATASGSIRCACANNWSASASRPAARARIGSLARSASARLSPRPVRRSLQARHSPASFTAAGSRAVAPAP